MDLLQLGCRLTYLSVAPNSFPTLQLVHGALNANEDGGVACHHCQAVEKSPPFARNEISRDVVVPA